jgi:NTE family protein
LTGAPDRQPRFVEPKGARPRVAVALGSGGPRGFAFVGVLKVLEEIGVKPDLVVGTSVGAMVGALYASGMGAERLERTAYELSMIEFFELGTLIGRSTGRPLQNYVNRQLGGRAIEELPIAFAATATRMRDRELVTFNAGDVGLAVRASSASPGDYLPVRVGEDLYIDGDEVTPVPIRVARQFGADVVIAVNVSAYLEDTPPNAPRAWVEKDKRRAVQIADEAREADVFLHPNIGYDISMREAYRRRVATTAETYTRERVAQIRAALARGAQAVSTARMPSGEASR